MYLPKAVTHNLEIFLFQINDILWLYKFNKLDIFKLYNVLNQVQIILIKLENISKRQTKKLVSLLYKGKHNFYTK